MKDYRTPISKEPSFERDSPVWDELYKSTLRYYAISLAFSALEERVKGIEESHEFIYRNFFRDKKVKRLFTDGEHRNIPMSLIGYGCENAPTLHVGEEEKGWEFKKWKEELDFFNSIKRKLLEDETYRNKFVAIKDKRLIDYDIDNFRLAKRVNEKYRNEVVLIIKAEISMPVAEIPSPEISI